MWSCGQPLTFKDWSPSTNQAMTIYSNICIPQNLNILYIQSFGIYVWLHRSWSHFRDMFYTLCQISFNTRLIHWISCPCNDVCIVTFLSDLFSVLFFCFSHCFLISFHSLLLPTVSILLPSLHHKVFKVYGHIQYTVLITLTRIRNHEKNCKIHQQLTILQDIFSILVFFMNNIVLITLIRH